MRSALRFSPGMACWLLACLACIPFTTPTRAATFSSTPASLTTATTNAVVLSVGGLVSQQQVRIELFRDANGNGSVDPGDDLVLSFNAADGELSPFPATSEAGSAGDDDGATNGQVRKTLTLTILPEIARVVGSYVFKVSAVDASFASMTQPFTINAGTYSQAVDGRVLAGGVPVPSAMVALLSVVGEDVQLITAGMSDGAGHFNVKAPPGDYMLLAIKQGYVADMGNAAGTSLISGVNSTQDVTLVTATSSISGRVVDQLTSNGIPGLQLFLESPEGLVTIVTSDASGNFSGAVTPALWKVGPSERAIALMGYGEGKLHVDTTGGPATNVTLKLSRSRGSFQLVFFYPDGGFGSGTNGLVNFPARLKYYFALYNVKDTDFPTSVLFTGPVGSGLSGTPSAVFGGTYGDSAFYSSPQVDVSPYPPGGQYEVNYKGQPQRFMLANPDAQNRQVCLLPTVVLNPAGELTEVRWSYRDVNGSLISPPAFLASIELRVDGVGGRLYDGDAMPGETSHVVNSTVVWTNVSSLQMVYNDADDNQYVTFWRFGYRPLLAARLELLPVPGPGQFALRLVGEAGRSYTLEYSTTLTNWFTLLTTNTTTGTNLDLVDTTATNRNRFYRVRLNP